MTAVARSRLITLLALTGAVTLVLVVASFTAERVIAPHVQPRLPALLPARLFASSLQAPLPGTAAPVPAALLRALAPPGSLPPPPPPPPPPARRARPAPDSLPLAPPLEHIEEDLWQP